jgi:DNA mismatch repair protein MutS2
MSPAPLAHTSAHILEFEALRDLLRGYTSSPLGAERVSALAPTTDRATIEQQQQLTVEIREFRRVGGRFEFSGLLDVTAVGKIRIASAALEATEIRDIILVVDPRREWAQIALIRRSHADSVDSGVCSLGIPDFTEFLRTFRNKIQPDGTLEDRASPELARIRRDIEKQRRTIQESLRGYLRRLAEGGTVQDELVTIRGERFVIPVKIEQKRRVPGVVHGSSSSGQTVFVEPIETIEQNNDLVRLLDEEQAEIHRILVEMTRRIGEQAASIRSSLEVLAELELQFAKARFAEDYYCVPVTVSGPGSAKASEAITEAREDGRPRPAKSGNFTSAVLHNSATRCWNAPQSKGHSRPDHHRTRRRAARAGHHRSKHRRKNRHTKNRRTPRPDGSIRHPGFRGPG